ncbi:hypothetical protein Fmac_009420 [Flemingia macrophylla]|uniref:F-box protein n=1 Tax=Flemingia macrophylla TaxID=520843 RepID=A0ABD1N2Q4_9FABA
MKVLLQLRRVCKSWKMLISNPGFAKNQFPRSVAGATRLIATINSDRHILRSCPLRSVLNDGTIISTELKPPLPLPNSDKTTLLIGGSCNDILCLATVNFVLVWNPTIAKFKTLPLPVAGRRVQNLGFGYDNFEGLFVSRGYSVNTSVHVWLMGEHGIKESWTRLFTFHPKLESLGYVCNVNDVYETLRNKKKKKKKPLRAVCIFEDGQVLFDCYGTFLYNPLHKTLSD